MQNAQLMSQMDRDRATEIPVVIQRVGNPQLEFPPQVAGLPKEYLLGSPRPVVMEDFFENGSAITLKVRDRLKMVTLGIALHVETL